MKDINVFVFIPQINYYHVYGVGVRCKMYRFTSGTENSLKYIGQS